MVKFIEIKAWNGEDFIVNVDRIHFLHREVSKVTGEDVYCIELPGQVIWVTKEEFNRVKAEIV